MPLLTSTVMIGTIIHSQSKLNEVCSMKIAAITIPKAFVTNACISMASAAVANKIALVLGLSAGACGFAAIPADHVSTNWSPGNCNID